VMKAEYSSSRWKIFLPSTLAGPDASELSKCLDWNPMHLTYERTTNGSKSCDCSRTHRQDSDRCHFLSSVIRIKTRGR
jgi:hypothetical protein